MSLCSKPNRKVEVDGDLVECHKCEECKATIPKKRTTSNNRTTGLQKDVNLPNPQILKFETFLIQAVIFDHYGLLFRQFLSKLIGEKSDLLNT